MTEIQAISPADYNKYALTTNVEPKVNSADEINSLPSNNLPPVYDSSLEPKEKFSMGARGAVLLSLTMLAIGGYVGHKLGGKNMKSAKEALEKSFEEQKQKAEDAKNLYEEAKEKADNLQKDLNDILSERNKKPCWYKNLINCIKNTFKEYKK